MDITSNTNWSVTSDQSWLSINPSSGSGNGALTINALANLNNTSRTAIVTISATGTGPMTISVVQSASLGTGIGELNNEEIIIFPNPVTEQFCINGIGKNASVCVTDINGRALIQRNVKDEEWIPIHTLAQGLYFVRIAFSGKTVEKKLIVK